MSDQESIGSQATSSTIEYGGWGLLLLFFLRKLCTLAQTNGIVFSCRSPCRVACDLDTTGHDRDSTSVAAELVSAVAGEVSIPPPEGVMDAVVDTFTSL